MARATRRGATISRKSLIGLSQLVLNVKRLLLYSIRPFCAISETKPGNQFVVVYSGEGLRSIMIERGDVYE
jgi:hypothetical protein